MMPEIIVGFYLLIFIAVVVFAVFGFIFLDKRYRQNHKHKIPAGYTRTEEVTIDPGNGKRFRVYYNSGTGDRFYQEENDE
jgi:hypothetical protein